MSSSANWNQVMERQYAAYDIDLRKWAMRKPFGISGCVRVRNDAEFLEEAIESHLPWLDECVLAVQPSEDRTEEIARELERKHDKVRVCMYPVIPVFVTDAKNWGMTPDNSIKSFVFLSNWALTQCRYSWISKFEADVVCLSSFGKIRAAVEAMPERVHYYGRVILNVAGEKRDRVSLDNPRNGGYDEAVFNNHPMWHFVKTAIYETISLGAGPHTCMGWSALHLKRCKRGKMGWNGERYVPFTPVGLAAALTAYNAKHAYEGPDNPLGEACLFERSAA